MKTSSFSFELPDDQIAQQPAPERGSSRLLVLERESGRLVHTRIGELCSFIEAGTVMVLNDSRVRKARLFGTATGTGGKVDFLLLEEIAPGLWKTLVGKARKQRPGKEFLFPAGVKAKIVEPPGTADRPIFRYLLFSQPIDEQYFENHGHVPLPPYIRRSDTRGDGERYQTVYARKIGSSAAPTAGLHLTEQLLDNLAAGGIIVERLTLQVGTGTFLPIRSSTIEEHSMHEESYEVPERTAAAVNSALAEKRKVLAVGTTVVRALETAFSEDKKTVLPGRGSTSLFIYPGYTFRVVSQLLTNFHTPRSSLLVLVATFAGRQRILSSYKIAVEEGYRFFSYGDAMLIL